MTGIMKITKKPKKVLPEEPPSPISTEQYLALPDGERCAYRPVHPKWERLPRWCFVLYGIGTVCLVLYLIMSQSPAFSDWFNVSVSAPLRMLAAALTSPIPFSLAEFAIFLIPLILFFVIRYAMRHYCDTWRSSAVFMGMLDKIIKNVPIYNLYCNMEDDAARVAYNGMKGN